MWQGRKIWFDPESDAFGRHSFGFVVCELKNVGRDRRSVEDELTDAEPHHRCGEVSVWRREFVVFHKSPCFAAGESAVRHYSNLPQNSFVDKCNSSSDPSTLGFMGRGPSLAAKEQDLEFSYCCH